MIPLAKDPVATLVFFLLVFVIVGAFFLFIHLVMGSFIRPYVPDKEKLTIYECGEPTVGSAWIQFDLRYYVVALLFVIFDVEVAFFFPWATVFGKANQIAAIPEESLVQARQQHKKLDADLMTLEANLNPKKRKWKDLPESDRAKLEEAKRKAEQLTEAEQRQGQLSEQLLPTGMSKKTKIELGLATYDLVKNDKGKQVERQTVTPITPEAAKGWAMIAFWDIFVFFGVLMVGFAYVWRRGDINWVRSYAHHLEPPAEPDKILEQKIRVVPPAPAPPVAVH